MNLKCLKCSNIYKTIFLYFHLSFIFISIVLLSYSNLISSDKIIPQEKYSLVRVDFNDKFTFEDAMKAGFEPLQPNLKECCYMEIVAGKFELELLKSKSVNFEILIDDMESDFENKLKDNRKDKLLLQGEDLLTPGSMGGFYTLEEIYAIFQEFVDKYPILVSSEVIGKSNENRDIIAFCFGKCLGSNNYPGVLITSLIHAREPASVTSVIYFLKDLMKKYDEGDVEAYHFINFRKIVVVPVLNPDGLVYNQTNRPNGGGMRRKNMRVMNDSAYGVDLNRNFGPEEFWNAPVDGSSTEPRMDTYRGSAAFSEPEAVAIKELAEKNYFNTALGVHSFGDYFIFPFGALQMETPDSILFRSLGHYLHNGFRYVLGTDRQTLFYSTRGGLDDYMYLLDINKQISLAATLETGNYHDSFWPKSERINQIARDHLNLFYQMVWSADYNLRPVEVYAEYNDKNAELVVNVQNIGMSKTRGENLLEISTTDNSIVIDSAKRVIKSLGKTEIQENRFNVKAVKGFDNGKTINFAVKITQNGVDRIDTFSIKMISAKTEYLFDGKSSAEWYSDTWGTEIDKLTGELVLSDSPGKNYADTAESYLYYQNPIDLTSTKAASLFFDARWNIERNFDLAGIQISQDGGITWHWQPTNRTYHAIGGINNSIQKPGDDIFHGYFPWWLRQEVDLNKFLGKTIYLRFGLVSDKQKNVDGISLKNIRVTTFDEINSIESDIIGDYQIIVSPQPFSKSNGSMLYIKFKNLIIGNDIKVTLIDLLGRKIDEYHQKNNSSNAEIIFDVSRINNGVFLLLLEIGGKIHSKKIVIID